MPGSEKSVHTAAGITPHPSALEPRPLPGVRLELRPNKSKGTTMAGTTDKIKGSVKEAAGKVTGDKRTEAGGRTDRAKGDVKGAARDVKQAGKGVGDSLRNGRQPQ